MACLKLKSYGECHSDFIMFTFNFSIVALMSPKCDDLRSALKSC